VEHERDQKTLLCTLRHPFPVPVFVCALELWATGLIQKATHLAPEPLGNGPRHEPLAFRNDVIRKGIHACACSYK